MEVLIGMGIALPLGWYDFLAHKFALKSNAKMIPISDQYNKGGCEFKLTAVKFPGDI